MEAEAVVGKSRKGFIYVASFAGYYKIGRTKDPATRLRSIVAVKFPEQLIVRLQIEVADAIKAEKALHVKYRTQHCQGEWFKIFEPDLPKIEQFLISEEYLRFFPDTPLKSTIVPTVVDSGSQSIGNNEDFSTFDRDRPWKMRHVDLVSKSSLHDVPVDLKTKPVVNFAYYPYSWDMAYRALGKIERHYGYKLGAIWDGPYNACVWKLENLPTGFV